MNLFCSARKVLGKKGAAGVDRQTVADFAEHEREELRRLHEQLRDGSYRPSPVRRTWIPKPGGSEKRPLGIPTVRDRAVQTALLHVIEPILDATFHERSFGFRHGRGCHDALRCVEELLEAGYVYVVDADLKGYFDTSSSVARRAKPRRPWPRCNAGWRKTGLRCTRRRRTSWTRENRASRSWATRFAASSAFRERRATGSSSNASAS